MGATVWQNFLIKKIKGEKSKRDDGEAKGTLRDEKDDRSIGLGVRVWEKIFYVIFFIYYFHFSKKYMNSKRWKGEGGQQAAIEFFMKTFGQQMDGVVMKNVF